MPYVMLIANESDYSISINRMEIFAQSHTEFFNILRILSQYLPCQVSKNFRKIGRNLEILRVLDCRLRLIHNIASVARPRC